MKHDLDATVDDKSDKVKEISGADASEQSKRDELSDFIEEELIAVCQEAWRREPQRSREIKCRAKRGNQREHKRRDTLPEKRPGYMEQKERANVGLRQRGTRPSRVKSVCVARPVGKGNDSGHEDPNDDVIIVSSDVKSPQASEELANRQGRKYIKRERILRHTGSEGSLQKGGRQSL